MTGVGWAFIIAAVLSIPFVIVFDTVSARIRARIQKGGRHGR